MPASLTRPDRLSHRLLPETASRMAKADVRKSDISDFRVHVGHAIQRAMRLRGWSLKELSGAIDRDSRQVARWIAGQERPHFDALFAVEDFQQPLVIALAELVEHGIEVETVVRVKGLSR